MTDIGKLSSVLGINRRNLEFIHRHNPRSAFPLVDDKTLTKKILRKARIPVPETLATVNNPIEIPTCIDRLLKEDSFVVKPARGRAGGGVLLIERGADKVWRTPSGRIISREKLHRHLAEILFGVYSFGSMGDSALIERKIIPHVFFHRLYPGGIPDIRVITYMRKPIASMLRIPTDRSDGKANLHQGAIGVGIDTDTGVSNGGVSRGRKISTHPDSGENLSELLVPYWKEILDYAVEAAGTVPLGYLGIDFVIDQFFGPQILELNARPGLQIQVVNQLGLLKRLREISV